MYPIDNEKNTKNDNIINLVLSQIEYQFSDVNLAMDNYLLSKMHEDPEYWISIKTVANLTKIHMLTDNENIVLQAIKKSNLLKLNEAETKVKRPNFIPQHPKQHKDLRRTVFICGLSNEITNEKLLQLCYQYGTVKKVIFDDPSKSCDHSYRNNPDSFDFNFDECDQNGGPNREVAIIIMAKRFGNKMSRNRFNHGNGYDKTTVNASDFSHLRSCFAVFESQSQANKFVKSRQRCQDGIHAIHQYDFIRAYKKIAADKARGISPLFSPQSITSSSSSSFLSPLSSSIMNGCLNQKNTEKDNTNLQLPSSVATSFKQPQQLYICERDNNDNDICSRTSTSAQPMNRFNAHYLQQFSQHNNTIPSPASTVQRSKDFDDNSPSVQYNNQSHNINYNEKKRFLHETCKYDNPNIPNNITNSLKNPCYQSRRIDEHSNNHSNIVINNENYMNTINLHFNHALNLKEHNQQVLQNNCRCYVCCNQPVINHSQRTVESSNYNNFVENNNALQCNSEFFSLCNSNRFEKRHQQTSAFNNSLYDNYIIADRNNNNLVNLMENNHQCISNCSSNDDDIMSSSSLGQIISIPPTPPLSISPSPPPNDLIFSLDMLSDPIDLSLMAPFPTCNINLDSIY